MVYNPRAGERLPERCLVEIRHFVQVAALVYPARVVIVSLSYSI